ncbi:hypothetical protein [Streptomyces peucetius]|uniref:Large membrane protein n=1 Tax=Streptomyces peucetius TaxID=1950 RepID=A0ABY6I636_STRPE|nr:hypothetical protein [Streptomyces peucetius]UYQ61695.1 hypothetical protein OGH68_09490 [Streptomyces peucetius]
MSSTENTQETPRRRRSPLVVASVAAAVLVAGGGGAYFATSGFDGGDSGEGVGAADAKGGPGEGKNPPLLALDTGGPGTDGGIAPGEPDPNGGVVYVAEGDLPEGPDRAAVHRATGSVTAAEVTRLAKALGLSDAPRLEGPAWKVGPSKDGQGPTLQVNKDAPGTWTFARYVPAPGGDNCLKGKACPSGGADEPGPVVSEAEARKAAAPVLEAVGQGDAALDAGQLMGAVRVVNANPVVSGLPTYGWSTGVQVGADGTVVGGSGQLKKPVKDDLYPVVSAEQAVERLNEAGKDSGRVGIGGCATPVPHKDDLRPETPCEPKGSPAGPERLTIAKAVFGLAAQYVDGRQALVPSWLFEVTAKDGGRPFTVTHTAVEERFLRSTEPPAKELTPPPPSKDPAGQEGPAQISYSIDGRTLTVTFWGSVCSTYEAKATETDDRVKVRIVETNPDPKRVCIMLAKKLTESVTLDEPLDGRQVVDANGKPLPRKG